MVTTSHALGHTLTRGLLKQDPIQNICGQTAVFLRGSANQNQGLRPQEKSITNTGWKSKTTTRPSVTL